MKKALAVIGLVLATTVSSWAVMPYTKLEGGLVGLGAISGGEVGVRVGAVHWAWDFSLGYSRLMGNLDSDKVEANGATVHLVGVEVYRSLWHGKGLSVGIGGGIGYAAVDLDGRDKAESDKYETLGASAQYSLSQNLSMELNVKGLWLNVDTHRTDYGSHTETLSSGQTVEVSDEYPKSNSLNLNSGRVGLALVYKF